MAKIIHYAHPDGTYNDAAYHRDYERKHSDRRAIWRLNTALRECQKYPSIMEEACSRCYFFAAENSPEPVPGKEGAAE